MVEFAGNRERRSYQFSRRNEPDAAAEALQKIGDIRRQSECPSTHGLDLRLCRIQPLDVAGDQADPCTFAGECPRGGTPYSR